MSRLESKLSGPKLYVKRDDLTGVALGGNKIRQLDYILVEAKKRHCDYVITTCGIQSNWSRQTVAFGSKMGMKALLVLRTAQFKNRPRVLDGNLLLDHIMGAEIKILRMKINEDPAETLQAEARRLREDGHNPIVLGLAEGISPLATVAYVDAASELTEQADAINVKLNAIVLATGVGATQAGLVLGTKILGLKTKIVGINVGAFSNEIIVNNIITSGNAAAKLLNSHVRLTHDDIIITDKYAGKGYGITTKESVAAIYSAAKAEALILDPVYTSKAMAGLIDMVRTGEFGKDERVCFLHTGGIPALFAYKEHFQPIATKTGHVKRSRGKPVHA